MPTKTQQLKRMLNSSKVEFLMEAHNGLSARIVEQTGFSGIWGSGLAISTALGVRDSNEASWTQVLETVEFMSEVSTIPLMLDVDTGYGDFNNVRRLVRKLEQREVAAMCMEDKLFPKTNSLLPGAKQPLAEVAEFVGKIKAAKDTQNDQDFCVIARTEAFIAGKGLSEALDRAYAYAMAGADAVLIHSKARTAEQIDAFMHAWQEPCPVVIIPTTYFDTPTSTFEDLGVSMIIWANHLLRSCITAMEITASRILESRSLTTVEHDIAGVDELFQLYDYDELKRAERKYLPESHSAGEEDQTARFRLKAVKPSKHTDSSTSIH